MARAWTCHYLPEEGCHVCKRSEICVCSHLGEVEVEVEIDGFEQTNKAVGDVIDGDWDPGFSYLVRALAMYLP